MAQGLEWVNMQRNLGEEQPNADGGWSTTGTSDMVFRNQFRTWANYMGAADMEKAA